MAHKSCVLLLTLVSLGLFSITRAGDGAPFVAKDCGKTARWCPINNFKDPLVVKTATLAVKEHNKQANKTLDFASVVDGEAQAGGNFRLAIATLDGRAEPKNHSAVVVYMPSKKFLQLVSFDEISCTCGF